jgi:hypothetical protein
MYDLDNQQHRKEICKWCLKLFEPCLDPNGSGKALSMFDKLDVRQCENFELYDAS